MFLVGGGLLFGVIGGKKGGFFVGVAVGDN